MLSQEGNDQLTKVGPGTPMGTLLRRYWYPVAMVRELEEFPVKKTRLLGENFAVYRTPSGAYGIAEERCPHRGASMVYAIPEEEGLRCGYHGWLFDRNGGRCLEQPAEPPGSSFKDKICLRSGKAQALGGLVWAYIGPDPAPELPRYEGYVMDGVRDIGHTTIPCNWLQIMENSVDPFHVEWLHNRYFHWLLHRGGTILPSAFKRVEHVKVAFDVFEHGIIKRRLLKGQTEEDDDWKMGHPLVFPYCMWVGGNGTYQMQIRVPVDDEETWVAFYTCHAPDGIAAPTDRPVVDYPIPWRRDDGTYITDYIEGQDIMAWVTQGRTADRTREHLGVSDAGVIALRNLFKKSLQAVADGQDPAAVVRTPHDRIVLPLERKKFGAGAEFSIQWLDAGSQRYSPQNAELKALHYAAARARGESISTDPMSVAV